MKLNKWLYGATALAMLAACSERDIAPGGDNPNNEVKYVDGVSYLGISLELPTEPTSRADDIPEGPDNGSQGNDNFADGTTTEYNVVNAAILLFQGEKEEDAEFLGAYVLGSDETFDNPENDNITTSFQRTIQVLQKPQIAEGSNINIWGLALVNYKTDHFDIKSTITNKDEYGKLTVKGTTKGDVTINRIADKKAATEATEESEGTPAVNPTKFKDFRELVTSCKFLNYRDDANTSLRSIFMTNAPLSSTRGTVVSPGASTTIQTLAVLDHSKFFNTKVDAMKDPAGCIFVERAVAKVTCSKFPQTTTFKRAKVAEDGTIEEQDVVFKITKVEWLIDNEEQNAFIVRNAQDTHGWWNYSSKNSEAGDRISYRFIGGASMNYLNFSDGNTLQQHDWFRTYWCKDPNYEITATNKTGDKVFYDQAKDGNYSSLVASTDPLNPTEATWASSKALYPHENTFDIDHQNYKNTTRVVFKVTYDQDVTINTLNADGSVKSSENKKNVTIFAIRGQLNDLYFREDAENILKRAVVSSNEIKETVKANLATGMSFASYSENDFEFEFGIVGKDGITSNTEKNILDGDYVIKSVRFKSSAYYSETNKAGYLDQTKETEINDTLDEILASANESYHLVPFNKVSDQPNADTYCYYTVYIQHFGDTYCKLPSNWTGTTVDKVYVKADGVTKDPDTYLGRYGMVRNNWYDIQVDKVGRLGNANVPSGDVNTSDDNKDELWYLSARIHVLSWAKRTQKVEF